MKKNIREIEVFITSNKESQSAVSISVISDYLHMLQSLMYITGDFLEGNNYRTGGNFPNSVKKRCDLVVKDLKFSSFGATITLSDSQTPLPFPEFPEQGTIGERALKMTKDIIEISADKDDIYSDIFETLPDEFRVHRCLKELESIWPDEKSEYSFNIGFNSKRPIDFDPKRKSILQNAIKKAPEKYKGIITGRLIEFRADRKRQCIIDTPDGEVICKFEAELQNTIFQNLTKLVTMSGMMEKKKSSVFLEFNDKSALKVVDSLTLSEVDFGEGDIKKLACPITLHTDYEDESDSYIISNDDFKLLAVANNLKSGMALISEELKILFEEYVEEDISNLTGGAILLREKLQNIFVEDF